VTIRDQSVLLDSDVAALYAVATKEVNQAVRNNPGKFPEGYIIQLNKANGRRSQILTSSTGRSFRFLAVLSGLGKKESQRAQSTRSAAQRARRAARLHGPSCHSPSGPGTDKNPVFIRVIHSIRAIRAAKRPAKTPETAKHPPPSQPLCRGLARSVPSVSLGFPSLAIQNSEDPSFSASFGWLMTTKSKT
jgi:hypothetical protein